jgi:hypothetical protein
VCIGQNNLIVKTRPFEIRPFFEEGLVKIDTPVEHGLPKVCVLLECIQLKDNGSLEFRRLPSSKLSEFTAVKRCPALKSDPAKRGSVSELHTEKADDAGKFHRLEITPRVEFSCVEIGLPQKSRSAKSDIARKNRRPEIGYVPKNTISEIDPRKNEPFEVESRWFG